MLHMMLHGPADDGQVVPGTVESLINAPKG
jgi:hypothetical protein